MKKYLKKLLKKLKGNRFSKIEVLNANRKLGIFSGKIEVIFKEDFKISEEEFLGK